MLKRKSIAALEKDFGSKSEKRRWQAAIELGEYCEKEPEKVWTVVLKYGSSKNADVRTAVATCVLEHLLEYHFEIYFSKSVAVIKSGNRIFGETLAMCRKFGELEKKSNSAKFDRFVKQFSAQAAG
jgi:hypothetical protein